MTFEASEFLGVNKERAEEISKGVLQTFIKAGMLDAGLEELAKQYDPESIVAGMAAAAVIDLNRTAHTQRRATISKQNAALN